MFVFTDTRVIHATASLEKAEQSAWFLSNNDTRMSVVRPPSQFLLVAPFRTKKKKKSSCRLEKMNKRRKSHSFWLDVLSRPRLVFTQMSYSSHIRLQSLFLSHIQRQKTHLVLFSTCSLPEKAACARIYPLGEPKSKNKICYKTNGVYYASVVCMHG